MSSHITVEFGRITGEPEMKFLPSGVACLEFNIADNHRKKVGSEWADDGATFWRVSLWREDAEANVEKLHKGTVVMASGEPRVVEYEKRDGTKGKTAEIRNAVVAIRSPRERQAVQQQQQQRPQQQAQDPWATPASAPTSGTFNDEPPF